MICTTLNKIRDHEPCEAGWRRLLKFLGKTEADNEPLPLTTVLDSNGLDDCLWCLKTVPKHEREWRLFAVWCARKVQHMMKDQRSIDALDVAERFANGMATFEELKAARDAAWAACDAARGSACGAARASWDAAMAAWAAARASWDAAWAAALAAMAAQDAAWAAERAARDAARDEQELELRRILEGK